MSQYTKEEILARFSELIEQRYYSEDARLERSNCSDESYYKEEGDNIQKEYDQNREMLMDLRIIVGQS